MLYPLGAQIPFAAQFTTSGAGATGLTVTVSVVRVNTDGSRTTVITQASATAATEVDSTNAKGLYSYWLAGASTGTAGMYLAIFHTAGTADLKDVPALEIVGAAWVGNVDTTISSRSSHTAANVRTEMDSNSTKLANLDATVSSRNATTPPTVAAIRAEIDANSTKLDVAVSTRNATTPPTVGAIADQVWDELLSGHAVSGSTGSALSAAGSAADPFLNETDDEDYTVGTMGELFIRKLGLVGTASGTVTSPMADDGSYDFTITRGDAYYAGGPAGREAVEWTNTADSWGDYVGKTAVFNALSGDKAIGPKTVVFTLTSPTLVTATMALTSLDTSAIANTYLGPFLFDVQVTMSTGVFETPISGTMTLLKDIS